MLSLLRRVTLARALVEERVVVAETRGLEVSDSRVELNDTRRLFEDIAAEWHRFDLQLVERRSREVLSRLESVNHRIGE